MGNIGKYTAFDSTPASTHNLLLGLIPRGSKVLEFGCATGYMSREMARRLECEIVGIELVAEAAELAKSWCRRVIVGDATALDFKSLFGDGKFDVILFADVLEHLYDPAGVLKKVRGLLSDNGAVICSIPNIAHGSVRLSLLAGEFNYNKRGLLDDTHIRFFTLKTLNAMFQEAGYVVSRLLRRRVAPTGGEVFIPPLPEDMVRWVQTQPEADAYQYVARAVPMEKKDAEAKRDDFLAAKKTLDSADSWILAVEESILEIERHIPKGGHFLLLDESHWTGTARWQTLIAHPCPEMDESYGGPPADDAQAVAELKRQEELGIANEVVVAWPAFWWLEHYEVFAEYLKGHYRIILENERIVIYRRT